MSDIKIVIDKALTVGHMADRVDDACEAGIQALTDEVGSHAEVEIGKIEKRAIPQWGSGNPRWERKGANGGILGGLTKEFPDQLTGEVTIEGDAKKYAARREGLGVDWQPKKPAPAFGKPKGKGVVRKNPFMRDTKRKMEPKSAAIFEAAFRAELDR